MPYALRKSVGPWSAGTRVNIVSDNIQDGTVTVEIQHVKPNKDSGVEFEDLVFDIETEYVVQLRERSEPAPKSTREERRAGKHAVEQAITNLMEKNK